MLELSSAYHVEPELLAGWLGARSMARGLPQPVPDHGGLRVDTGLPTEHRRYVFAGPAPAIRALALSIDTPHTYIKICGTGAQLRALVPSNWQLQPGAYLMTHAGARHATPPLPDGYRIALSTEQAATVARIVAADGTLAASGYAAEFGGVLIFDRIATEAAHRRRGLGSIVMAALAGTQQAQGARRVLVATEQGRALYSSLGWTVVSPYSTVTINSR